MEEILISLVSFILGFILAKIIFQNKNYESTLFNILKDFKSEIENYESKHNENTKEIKEAIKDANKLKNILTTNQNLKGQYGEDTLETILKSCFPNENINYIKQIESYNNENKKIRPDFLVKLPNDKSLIIDCKVNLDKYLEYKEEENKELKKIKKSDFIKDLNTTINNLSNKNYQNMINTIQVDFILMYIPLEPVITSIYMDKDYLSVIKNAIEKNIIIVGNSSILTTIRLVKNLWAINKQEKNMDKIISLASNIYNEIAKHSMELFNIKKLLEENNEKFNKEYEKFNSNSKLFKYVNELKDYGIQSKTEKSGKKLIELEINKDFIEQ